MIRCPTCHCPTTVQETRAVGDYLRRRRVCTSVACRAKVTTVELVVSVSDLRSAAISDPIVMPRRAVQDALETLATALAGRVGRATVVEMIARFLPTDPTNGET